MRGFGGLVTFLVKDADWRATADIVDAVRIPRIAPSLGGVESLIEQPLVMSYYQLHARGAGQVRHPRQHDPPLLRHRERGRPGRRPGSGSGSDNVTLRWYLAGIGGRPRPSAGSPRIATLSGWAPVGLLSLAVGDWARILRVQVGGELRCLAAGSDSLSASLLFALVTVFVEHAWLYRDFRRQWHEARASNPQVAMFRPEQPWSPAEYLRHEAIDRSHRAVVCWMHR